MGTNLDPAKAPGIYLLIGAQITIGTAVRVAHWLRQGAGVPVRAVASPHIYSAQFAHPVEPFGDRPTDWETQFIEFRDADAAHGPHPGDCLICLETGERYGYTESIGITTIHMFDAERLPERPDFHAETKRVIELWKNAGPTPPEGRRLGKGPTS